MCEHGVVFNPEMQHFKCFAHILNLGVHDTLKYLNIDNQPSCESDSDSDSVINNDETDDNINCIAKLRNLFKKIKYSEQLKNKLKICCETTNSQFVSPLIDVSTRWNSTYDMLQTGLILKNALKVLCENNENIIYLSISKN